MNIIKLSCIIVISLWSLGINAQTTLLGDVDGNGTLTTDDVNQLKSYILSPDYPLTNADMADVDGDGNVNIVDVALLIDIILHPDNYLCNGYRFVDLGLSVKWATCNVGAVRPMDSGLYYAWGETNGYGSDTSDGRSFNWDSYKWMSEGKASWAYCTKYTIADDYTMANWYNDDNVYIGTNVDGVTYKNKSRLDSDDDAASANWGGTWRMPTNYELTQLRQKCTWTWTTINGVNGYKVTSNVPGYTDKSIFLPAAGYRSFTSLEDHNSLGYYWSSTLYMGFSSYAYGIYFSSSTTDWNNNSRYQGRTIRPVCP